MIQQALNTLCVQTDGVILRLDHDTVVAMADKPLLRVPLHHLNKHCRDWQGIANQPLVGPLCPRWQTGCHAQCKRKIFVPD